MTATFPGVSAMSIPTRPTLRVYSMDNRGLTAEQIAVTFAMTSRSPDPFDHIAEQVSEQKAADFNNRWIVGYGHASVAEHAVLHLALENLSRLAADRVLDNRLASYTEKSSRYQVIAPHYFHIPDEIGHTAGILNTYRTTCDSLFATYLRITKSITDYLGANTLQHPDESDSAYRLRLRRRATDASRSVLPAATLTNLGLTANARTLERAISKLLSGDLAEVNEIGRRLRNASQPLAPTLVKYAQRNDWLAGQFRQQPPPPATAGDIPRIRILAHPDNPFRDLTIAILMRQYQDYRCAEETADRMSRTEQTAFISQTMAGSGRHDAPPREFEIPRYRIQFRFDYGALREFRRHRMQTCLTAPLTVGNGYATDPLIAEAGVADDFEQALVDADQAHHQLAAYHPATAQYLVTHAHYQTVVSDLSLRECYHLFRLRSSPAAHRSIREPVQAAMAAIENIHPGILQWLPEDSRRA